MKPPLFLSDNKIEKCLEKLTKVVDVTFASVSLDKLRLACGQYGEMQVSRHFLTEREHKTFSWFTFEKRKIEWLAGRIAVKIAVRLLLKSPGIKKEGFEDEEWKKWEVGADTNGRPYIKKRKRELDISISHSGANAVALALSGGTCGIDIQTISPQIIKVEKKFIDSREKSFHRKSPSLSNCTEEEYLTLIWSAKEALRKGSGYRPVIGFLEMTLGRVDGDLETGLIFQFDCARASKWQKKKVFTTYQTVCEDSVVSIMLER